MLSEVQAYHFLVKSIDSVSPLCHSLKDVIDRGAKMFCIGQNVICQYLPLIHSLTCFQPVSSVCSSLRIWLSMPGVILSSGLILVA